ncbi:uncharacterized protein LOC123553260 [Mercenaria mercenaria]|uniref:uncharacterized protein LOC123553260 n=1 Tax=Mercenaria mercenaria TaxID=6596 RepID=UPI00234F2C37|nr:uncharacterized protein LOC123553260 [Mercenaria mercenaria]
MMKFLIAVCVIAYAVAQNNHHPGNGDNVHHHPHPDGDLHRDHHHPCPDCTDANQTAVCVSGVCKCETITKRAAGCHDHDCTCPPGQTGFCNQNDKCECGDHNTDPVGKRAAQTCTTADDCPECEHHGSKVCEKGHCHCK